MTFKFLFSGALDNISSEATPMMDHSGEPEVDEDEADSEGSEGDSKYIGLNVNEWECPGELEGKLCYRRNLGVWSESR